MPSDPFTQLHTALLTLLQEDADVLTVVGDAAHILGGIQGDRGDLPSLMAADLPIVAVFHQAFQFNTNPTSTSFDATMEFEIKLISEHENCEQVNALRWAVFKALERARRAGGTVFSLDFVRRSQLRASAETYQVTSGPEGEEVAMSWQSVVDVMFSLQFNVSSTLA